MKNLFANRERLTYFIFIVTVLILIFSGLINCNRIVKPDRSKPLSQKWRIVEIIDFKIEHSEDFCERVTLQSLKYNIMRKIKDEVGTNGSKRIIKKSD